MFSSQFVLDVKIVGSTSRGHTGFLIHLPSAAVLLVRRIQPFLSLVNREVEFLRTNDLIVLHLLGIYFREMDKKKWVYPPLFQTKKWEVVKCRLRLRP